MNDWAEFRHFKYLLAIVEHKGFRAAAEQLHTPQPNLSTQAKQFQDLSANPSLPQDEGWPYKTDGNWTRF